MESMWRHFPQRKKSDKKSAINGKSRRLSSSAVRITREIYVFVIINRKLCQSKILSFFLIFTTSN